jgi:hypothetical protein
MREPAEIREPGEAKFGPRKGHGGQLPGTNYWALRKTENDGQIAIYTPHELLDKFEEYSEYVNGNPLKEAVLLQKTGETVGVPKMRAMSVKAFCLYIGVGHTTFLGYEKRTGYVNICAAIKDAIYCQKFEGAAAGLLNANLISRDLGLHDSVLHTVNDERKSVDELFPKQEEFDEVEIVQTKELPYGE